MDFKKINERSNNSLKLFMEQIGVDGDFIVESSDYPLVIGKALGKSSGEFITPETSRMSDFLKNADMDNQKKNELFSKGLIIIDSKFLKGEEGKEAPTEDEVSVVATHEKLHSIKNILIHDAIRDGKNENAFIYEDGKINQISREYSPDDDLVYVDSAQDVLKGDIDTSDKTIDKYKHLSSSEIDDIDFLEGRKDEQMQRQRYVDEALVELMALLSNRMYCKKEEGKTVDIWKELEHTSVYFEKDNGKDKGKGKDISIMSKIILKHKDFELFKWMLDPIGYSNEDIHYDFFKKYTEDDQELVEQFYDAANKEENDYLDSEEFREGFMDDIYSIACSEEAKKELTGLDNLLKLLENKHKENENEDER